jgi:hypothetical protein
MTVPASFVVSPRSKLVATALAAIGALVAIVGLAVNPERTWPNLLLGGFYVTSLAVSATFFLSTQRLTGARWSASLRRIPEALMLTLPVGVVVMVSLFFGRHTLFSWSRPGTFDHAPAIAGHVSYLKEPFVFFRMGLALALWGMFAWLFRRSSLAQDRNPGQSLLYHHRMNHYAAAFVLVFAVSFTLGAYDWIISLDPTWFSTMFGVFVFAGAFVEGIAAVALAAIILRERNVMRNAVSEKQLHDLGIMLFAFTVFWMYIWTCQYLLIWYGNIPEEVTHYAIRTNGPWLWLFVLNPILNWVVPFLGLMSVRAKRNPTIMTAVCVVLLFGHWLDLYMLIMPSLWPAPHIGVYEIAIIAGCLGAVYLLFVRNLARAPLVPLADPIMASERTGEHLHAGHAHS